MPNGKVDGPRIAIVGGGSVHWMPSLLADIALTPALRNATVTLHDIDAESLEATVPLAERIFDKAGVGIQVIGTTEREAALRGAEFVVVAIGVGGLDAMMHDLVIPAHFGITQSVGDTTGPGGLSRALRSIPVLVDIAREMERLCPEAWLINLTNPMTTLCRAVTKATSIRTIGLCHELVGALRFVRELFDVEDPSDVQYSVAGVNHLTWILGLTIRGEDGLQMLREHISKNGTAPKAVVANGSTPAGGAYPQRHRLKLELFNVFGALPAVNDRHTAEFFPYFLGAESRHGADYEIELTTIEHRRTRLATWQAEVRSSITGEREIQLVKSHEAVSDVIAALTTRTDDIHMVNLVNQGQIAELPTGAVVETLGVVGAQGARGITADPLPRGVLNTLLPHVLVQELIVDAALEGDRTLALQALLTDPLTVHTLTDADQMLGQLIEANAAFLPQFAN